MIKKNAPKSEASVLEGMVIQRRPKKVSSADNNIRNWRLFRGIETHQELSDLTRDEDKNGIGVNRVCISRLENGTMRYNQDHIVVIARALKVTPSDLIGTNPFDSGSIFAIYALASLSDKKEIETFMRGLRFARKYKKNKARSK